MLETSYGVEVDATLDHRLLSGDGIKDIKNDVIEASAITNAIEQIASTDKASLLDFFKEVEKNLAVYNGLKAKLANDEVLAQQLQDPNLNPAQKQDMLNEVTLTVMKELGYVANDTKLLATNEKGANNTQIKGHFGENNVNYVNDIYNQSTTELLESLGHEMTHAMDNQDGTLKLNDTDQNNYANNFGDDLAFYTGNALDYTNGSSLAPTNNHNQEQVTSKPSIFNTLDRNNVEFAGLDKTGGDDSVYLYQNRVIATDGINDNQVIDLTFGESFQFRTKDKYASLPTKTQLIGEEDISKYKNVLNLNNEDDFETLRQRTDMNYEGINKDTNIVFINGMGNDFEAATKSQDMISKDFSKVGLINNETGMFSYLSDFFEWAPNYLTKKDVLSAYQLQKLSPNTIVITHSAGNEDIHKANQVNALVGVKTPYKQISVGSPKSLTDLKESASKVDAEVITQINHPNDPVANGWVNEDGDYEVENGLQNLINNGKIPIIEDLEINHPFDNYYNKEGVKEEVEKVISDE